MHKPEGLQDEIIFYDTIAYYVPLQTTDRWSNLIHSNSSKTEICKNVLKIFGI